MGLTTSLGYGDEDLEAILSGLIRGGKRIWNKWSVRSFCYYTIRRGQGGKMIRS